MMSSLRMAIERIASSNIRAYSLNKDAKRFKRMVDRMVNKKKQPKFSPVLLTKSHQDGAYTNEGSKRLVNLNKYYMEEILIMMCGGTYKSQLSNLGIQITKDLIPIIPTQIHAICYLYFKKFKVKMAKGLNFLNIYWITFEKNIDEEHVSHILLKALEELQEQMGSIRFTSKVPLLKFVRDTRLENELQLDEIFQSADFGKDFKPVYESKVFTPDFVHKDEKFPEMRQDIFGLDHAKITESIKSKILKFRAIDIEWIDKEEEEEENHPLPEKLIVFTQKDFVKFYKRRRILELKMKKKLGGKYTDNEILEYNPEDLSLEEDDEDYQNLEEFDLEDDDDDDDEEDREDFR